MLTPVRAAELRKEILERADSVSGNDFWLNQRPFILSFGPEYPEGLSEICDAGLPEVVGWSPEDVVTLAAMCNRDEDHRLLANLCAELAEKEDGLIDFGGYLAIGPIVEGSGPEDALRIENPDGVTGLLFATSLSHYGDVSLLRSWLQHPSFRMVK